MRAIRNLLCAALTLLALSPLSPTRAQAPDTPSHILWQIGQVDHDDKEFALAPGRWNSYGEDSFYVVGQSKPESDWNYAQPGPADDWAGDRQHTSRIDFQLTQADPQGTCRLTLALVDSHPYLPPQLQISVNGHTWTQNTIRGSGADTISGHPSSGKPSEVTVEFPASILTTGLNTVKITTLRGSWLLYDAVTLTGPAGDMLGPAPDFFQIDSAEWLSNVLKRQGNTLVQVLQLHLINSGSPHEADLAVSGETVRHITIPHGRAVLDLPYPELKSAAHTQIQLSAQDKPVGEAIAAERKPCRHYTIYCLEHSHMDIGYAYLQQKALELHQEDLEMALKISAQASAFPSDERFRWNVESLYEVDDWLKKATPAQIAAFRAAVKNGYLGLSTLYCNELTGLCRPEELVSLLACSRHLRDKYNISLDSAMITDVPGYTWGLVPILAQSGVKYISWGPNGGDHTGFARGFDSQAFYWLSPSGKEKVLVWQGPNGYYPDFSDNPASLTRFLRDFDRINPNYPYDMLYDRRTIADNGPTDPALPAFVHSWNSQYAYPHLVIATTSQMFHDFAARYGSKLSQIRGDYTGYWEDGAASTARETAINRQAAETIAQAQILYSMLAPEKYPQARFDDAWKNALLYDEHTWGADRSWSEPESDFTTKQWDYKKQFALNAHDQAKALTSDAFRTIAAPGTSNTIGVFNTSSWKRSGLVTLPAEQSHAGDIVRDPQGKAVPSQRMKDGTLAFLATDIPPLSWRKYRIMPGVSPYQGAATATNSGVLKTGSLSLQIDPQTGGIVSWTVKGIPQDLVNAQDKTCRGLNDYLYVLGPSNDKVQYASGATLTVIDRGPLVATIRVDTTAPGGKSLSRLTQVVEGLDQVRITDTLDKLTVHTDEAVHFGFNFNVPAATVRMDMPWSVVRPDTDQTVNANKNVFPVGRWVDLSNDTYGVTCANLDSPMMEIGEITSPRESEGNWLRTAKRGSTIYWNVMNNYWHTNYKAYQPGAATFRYVLSAHHSYDQAAAQRFGIEQSQPLLAVPVKANEPDTRFPLTVNNAAVQITQCHPLPGGKEWLVRLFNGSNQPQSLTLTGIGGKPLHFRQTDLWGDNGKPTPNTISLRPMEIVTLRFSPGGI